MDPSSLFIGRNPIFHQMTLLSLQTKERTYSNLFVNLRQLKVEFFFLTNNMRYKEFTIITRMMAPCYLYLKV